MPDFTLKVTTRGVLFDLDEQEVRKEFGDKVVFKRGPGKIREAVGAVQVATFIFEIAKDLVVALFAEWLFKKLAEQGGKATVNEQPVKNRQALEEMLRIILEREPE
jgi:hypothetical protein